MLLFSKRNSYLPLEVDEEKKQDETIYQRFNLFNIGISLFIFSSIILLVCMSRPSPPFLLQPNLSKTTPYRVISHPEPITSFWGTVTKPYPTGAFWTNLVIKNGDGAVGVYPYGVKTIETGIQVSYGAFRRSVSPDVIIDPFASDLQISAAQAYISRAVEAYDNVSVTMGYKVANNGKYRTFLVKGSPFITVYFDNATPVISSAMKFLSVDAKVVKDSSPSAQYLVTLGNYQKWLIYCSESVVFNWKDNSLSASVPIKGVVRIAVLPVQNTDAAFMKLFSFIQKYPIGGSTSLSYPTSSTGVVNIQYNTIGTGQLLMLALPHHIPLLPSTTIDSDDSKKVQAVYTPIWCIKGKLKPVVGDNWRLTYQLEPVGWNYNLANTLSNNDLEKIANYLIEEVKLPLRNAIDSYNFGKQIGRVARLALIADNLGIADARQAALQNLETSIIPWLQGMNQDVVLYDKVYGGLVTSNGLNDPLNNFGSGWYSDHHFHFGYFINAIATLAKLDLPFYESNKAALDAYVRDVCNYDITDLDFPFARHKDLFDGHSWASGLFQQANGKGQESSSEAVNAYYGSYLHGIATNNPDLQKFALLMMTMEIQASQTYWHMNNDNIYDSVFSSSRMVGNMGALDVTTTTWFGKQLEYVHGINMMPLSPATALLFDRNYVQFQYPILAARWSDSGGSKSISPVCSDNPTCKLLNLQGYCCPASDGVMLACCEGHQDELGVSDEWKSYIISDLAVVDRETAMQRVQGLDGFGIGNSRTNSLFWAASRSVPSLLDISPQAPNRTVKPACSRNSACDAIGLLGDCCPNSDGIFLGCCPHLN